MSNLETLKDLIIQNTTQIKDGGEYIGCGPEMRDKWYLHTTPELESAALSAYVDVSNEIQGKIEELGGFVHEVYSIYDPEYTRRIARIIMSRTGSGDPVFDLIVRLAEAINARTNPFQN